MNKIIACLIILTQDDIDYLKHRASECLANVSKEKSQHEKIRQWRLYNAYYELWEANKDNVGK